MTPDSDECLVCFLERSLDVVGCDGTLALSEQWRLSRPDPIDWLHRWLENRGGYCDCEVLLNVFRGDTLSALGLALRCPASLATAIAAAEDEDEDDVAW